MKHNTIMELQLGDDCLIYENYVHDNTFIKWRRLNRESTDLPENLIYKMLLNEINGSPVTISKATGYSIIHNNHC